MWFAWFLIVWFLLAILIAQGRVGVKPSATPVTQGAANVITIIDLAIIAGIVAYFL